MGYLERVFRATEGENRRVILETLPRGRGGSLLDLGTWNGEFTLRVAERVGAQRTVGVEIVGDHAERARALGIEVVQTDLDEGLPFEDGAFETVHANQVIEHVRRTDRFLEEIHRVLAPGGIACISTNNIAGWHNVLSLVFGWQPPPMHVSDEVIVGNPLNPHQGRPHEDAGQPHLRLFTGRALSELCATHGLARILLRTTGYYPLPPRVARLALKLDASHGAFLIGLFQRG